MFGLREMDEKKNGEEIKKENYFLCVLLNKENNIDKQMMVNIAAFFSSSKLNITPKENFVEPKRR